MKNKDIKIPFIYKFKILTYNNNNNNREMRDNEFEI